MVDFTVGTKPCELEVNNQCFKLRVKCLERRVFGGVGYGDCAIREVTDNTLSIPKCKRAKPPGDE